MVGSKKKASAPDSSTALWGVAATIFKGAARLKDTQRQNKWKLEKFLGFNALMLAPDVCTRKHDDDLNETNFLGSKNL